MPLGIPQVPNDPSSDQDEPIFFEDIRKAERARLGLGVPKVPDVPLPGMYDYDYETDEEVDEEEVDEEEEEEDFDKKEVYKKKLFDLDDLIIGNRKEEEEEVDDLDDEKRTFRYIDDRIRAHRPYKERKENVKWIDLFDFLYKHGILFLVGDLTHPMASHLAALIVHLSVKDPTRDILLHISSRGGNIRDGIALTDTMTGVRAKVRTITMGSVETLGALVMSSGVPKRIAFPHARVMLRPLRAKLDYFDFEKNRKPSDAVRDLKQFQFLNRMIIKQFASTTWKSESEIAEDMRRFKCMSASEAVSYGLIDAVARISEV